MTMTPRLISVMLEAPPEVSDDTIARTISFLVGTDMRSRGYPFDRALVKSRSITEQFAKTARFAIFGEGEGA